jgi:hypothetical protein
VPGYPVPVRQRGEVLVYALNRWQTLVVVVVAMAGVACAVAFFQSSIWLILLWLLFGLVGVGAMALVSFRDAESVDEATLTRADLGRLRDAGLREKVARASEYLRCIRQTVREIDSPELRSAMDATAQGQGDPVELVYTLALRLDEYRRDRLLQQDLARLQAKSAHLTPAEQTQMEALAKLQQLMNDTSAAIDAALAQLGASYSAVQLAESAEGLQGGDAQRALDELQQQSAQLRDLSISLDEVYRSSGRGLASA